MSAPGTGELPSPRAALEHQVSEDLRSMAAGSDRLARAFARVNGINYSDFQALLHIRMAEEAGQPLTPAQLCQLMHVSPPAITYLVDRMMEAGYIRSEPDPTDKRRKLLRQQGEGITVALAFLAPLQSHIDGAMAAISDDDLVSAHRAFAVTISALTTVEQNLSAVAQAAPSTDGGRSSSGQ